MTTSGATTSGAGGGLPTSPATAGVPAVPLVRGPGHTLVLGDDLRSPARARRVVAARCATAGLPDDVTEMAVLLTSELVTNAVVHGQGAPRLDVVAGPAGVHVAVSDESGTAPVVRAVSPDASGGRGMAILDAWADAWAVVSAEGSKTVWFEVLVR